MRRFVEGADRGQSTLFPECLADWIGEDNPVRVIDVFVDELDLAELGFNGVEPEVTGRPSYHPSALLKLYIYGYLNRVQSSRLVADTDEKLGQPVVPNGLPLSKIHHAAFDAHLIGIDPDYRLHVSERLLGQKDGPMLEALKLLNGGTVHLPKRPQDRPTETGLRCGSSGSRR